MRHIPLRTAPWPAPDAPPLSYRSAILQILFAAPASGHLTGDLILARCDVAQVVKALPDDASMLALEEEQYRVLVQAEKNFPWATANEAIAEFIRTIRDAPKVDANTTTVVDRGAGG